MVFERIKNLTRAADDEGADFECQQCRARFEVQRQVCPECGGYHIERTKW